MSALLADLRLLPGALLLGMLLGVLALGLLPRLTTHRRPRTARLPPWTPPWLRAYKPPFERQGMRKRRMRMNRATMRQVTRWKVAAVLSHITRVRVTLSAMPTRHMSFGTTISLRFLSKNTAARPPRPSTRPASPRSPAPARPVSTNLTFETVSAGCDLIEAALQAAALDGAIRAIVDTGRAMTIDLALPTLPSAAQRRLLLTAARTLAPKARWSNERLYLPGPFVNAGSLPRRLCVPILRQRRTTIWWSLGHVQHIILAGDALPTLLGMLPALTSFQERRAASLAVYDPARILGAQKITFTAAPDALSQARTRAHRNAWRGQPAVLRPLVLLAIAPDALAWADLAPLLASRQGNIHVVVLLGADADHQAARAACHQVGVVEVGGPAAAPLPESFRPPGLAAPRDRSALAWHTHRSIWRGTPLDSAGALSLIAQEVSP